MTIYALATKAKVNTQQFCEFKLGRNLFLNLPKSALLLLPIWLSLLPFFWREVTSSHCQSLSLTHCLLGNFSWFFAVCWFFSKLTFWKYSFRNIFRMSNSLDPDQARRIVGPDLGPNCLPRISADDTGRQRVKGKGQTLHQPATSKYTAILRIWDPSWENLLVVFATLEAQSLYYLNLKFPASGHLL